MNILALSCKLSMTTLPRGTFVRPIFKTRYVYMEYINDDRFRVFGIFRPNQSRVSPDGERRYCQLVYSYSKQYLTTKMLHNYWVQQYGKGWF